MGLMPQSRGQIPRMEMLVPADAVGQLGEVFSLTGDHQTVAASFWEWLGQQDLKIIICLGRLD